MQTIKLNSGYEVPVLGLGTWQAEPHVVGNAVEVALMQANYRNIDCAAIYGNEKEIGVVFAKVFKTVKREDVFITSKLWNTNHRPENVEEACKKTLSDLQLKYLDLYLMHWGLAFDHIGKTNVEGKIVLDKVSIKDTWVAMENLVKKGLVHSIGVANFTAAQMNDLLNYAQIKPAMNQIELHPYNSQESLVRYLQQNDIAVTAYSPLGRQGVKEIKGKRLFDEDVIKNISLAHNKSRGQILLRWAIQRNTIAIPKSTSPERIKENIDIFDFELTAAEMQQIGSLNKNLRLVDPGESWGFPYFA